LELPLAPGVGLDGSVPSVTVTSLSVRFTFAAHVHRLHDSVPRPTMVAPLPFTVMGLVTTGKPPPAVASVVTA
jgi:hypothetical protein